MLFRLLKEIVSDKRTNNSSDRSKTINGFGSDTVSIGGTVVVSDIIVLLRFLVLFCFSTNGIE